MLPGDEINQIVSYEFYGLFVNLKGKPYFVEIEPDKIIGRNADGTLAMTDPAAKCYSYVDTLRYDVCCPNDTTLTLGLRVREDAKNIHCPAATEFKFA